jgi:hypothetical protein
MRILVEQRFGRDNESRRADTTLQRSILKKFLLQRMQAFRTGDAFNGGDLAPGCLDPEHTTGVHQDAIEDDTAGTTVAVIASFLAAGKPDNIA